MRRVRPLVLVSAALLTLVSRPAFAGPPLLCFPFDIGAARSLPMGSAGWRSIEPSYDPSRLVDDTMALLTPQTPVIVRMETLRRATIYAAAHPKIASALLNALQERASVPHAGVALNVFDFGYLVETYRQARPIFQMPVDAIDHIDGYQLVLKAHALHGDAGIQFAAAVMTEDKSATRDQSRAHLDRARADAGADAMLAANISRHFQ